jgi:hypothetical protein
MKTRISFRSILNPLRLAAILLLAAILPPSIFTSPTGHRASAAPSSGVTIYLPNITRNYQKGVNGAIVGVVNDSTTGTALAGASVCVDGEQCIITLADGKFSYAFLSAGDHTVTVTLTDYADFSQVVAVHADIENYLPVSLSKTNLTQGAIRIVLTWLVESDMDAHLWIWAHDKHIYYPPDHRGNCLNLEVDLACLESDNLHFGPETITIRPGVTGTDSFAVERLGELEVTQYGAVVNIYDSNGLIQTIYSPTTGVGRWWHVFNLTWDPSANQYNIILINDIRLEYP